MNQFINTRETLVTEAIDGLLRTAGGRMARLDGYASDFSTLVAQARGGSWQPVAALASATLAR